MKQCPQCATKNPDQAKFCQNCGANLENVLTSNGDFSAAASDLFNKASGILSEGAKKAKAAAETGAEKVQELQQTAAAQKTGQAAKTIELVDPEETIIAVIGNSYMQRILSGENIRQGYAVLTDRRLYCSGKQFTGGVTFQTKIRLEKIESVVSVEDISYTRFTHSYSIVLLVLSMLSFLLASILLIEELFQPGLLIAVGIFLAFITASRRNTLLEVYFPGGNFEFDTKLYTISEMREFQRQIQLAKDHRRDFQA